MMFFSMFEAKIIGNVTKDPEVTTTGGGMQIAKFGVAINKQIKDGQGGYRSEAVFLNLVAFSKNAEQVSKYLKKGVKGVFICDININKHEGKTYTDFIVQRFMPINSERSSSGIQEPPSY